MSDRSSKILIVLFVLLLVGPPWILAARDKGKGLSGRDQKTDESATEKATKLFGPDSREVLILSLDRCIDRALVYNSELKVAELSIEGATEKKNEVSRIGQPLFEYEYNLGPVPRDVAHAVPSFFSGDLTVFNRLKLGLGVPIQTFGKVKTGRALAENGIEAERERKAQKKAEIILSIKQLYNGILLAREIHHLLKAALDGLQEEIQKREGEGGQGGSGADPSQLLKLKLFRAELSKRIEEGDKKQILAMEALRLQLGIDPTVRFDIASDKLRPSEKKVGGYEPCRQEALASRSDLKLLEIGYRAKSRQATLEKRLMTPNLAVGGFFEIGRAPGITGVTATDDFTNPFNFNRAGLGLQLKGQLDYHTSISKVRQIEAEVHKIEIQRSLARSGVELEVKEAFLEVRNTRLDTVRAEEAGKLSRQLLFLTQSNFDIGIGDSKDLIDAISSFLETRGRYFEAVFNYNAALAKLDQKIGRVPKE